MGIDELQSQQRGLEEWESVGRSLATSFDAALSIVQAEVTKRSGLNLFPIVEKTRIDAYPDSCALTGNQPLRLSVRGLVAEVEVGPVRCVIKRSSGGNFLHQLSEHDDETQFKLEITRNRPSIPVRVRHFSWTQQLWWADSSDNTKLIASTLAAFDKSEATSEFELVKQRSKAQSGCAILLLFPGVLPFLFFV
jgi:hypothetical protein